MKLIFKLVFVLLKIREIHKKTNLHNNEIDIQVSICFT